jgi:protein-arginine deiminase
MPAMTNLLNTGGGTYIIPEPFVSQTDIDFNNAFRTLGAPEDYLDDWYFLHTGDGEIHCGTNAKRAPDKLECWWEN